MLNRKLLSQNCERNAKNFTCRGDSRAKPGAQTIARFDTSIVRSTTSGDAMLDAEDSAAKRHTHASAICLSYASPQPQSMPAWMSWAYHAGLVGLRGCPFGDRSFVCDRFPWSRHHRLRCLITVCSSFHATIFTGRSSRYLYSINNQ